MRYIERIIEHRRTQKRWENRSKRLFLLARKLPIFDLQTTLVRAREPWRTKDFLIDATRAFTESLSEIQYICTCALSHNQSANTKSCTKCNERRITIIRWWNGDALTLYIWHNHQKVKRNVLRRYFHVDGDARVNTRVRDKQDGS